MNPGKTHISYTYSVVAGLPLAWGGAGARVQTFHANAAPQVVWWGAVAMCDNDGTAGTLYDGKNAVFITASDRSTVAEFNVQQ